MSSVYLLVHTSQDPRALEAVFDDACAWLPFVPESTHSFAEQHPSMRGVVWSTFEESVRGPHVCACDHGTLVFNGWIVEPTPVQRDRSVAQNVCSWLKTQPSPWALETLEGDFSALFIDPKGSVTAVSSALCGQHIYYGERNGVRVISNRAVLVSRVLGQGTFTALRPEFFTWFLSAIYAPHGSGTPWTSTKLLQAEERLSLDQNGFHVRPHSLLDHPPGALCSWREHFERLGQRVASIRNAPVRSEMALTGGKDSRIIFAAMLATGADEALDSIYLRADPTHADAQVAQRVAQRYNRTLDLYPPAPPNKPTPFFERLASHVFLTEHSLHAWDLKSYTSRPRTIGLHGHYGEIYKSHTQPFQLGGWNAVRPWYMRQGYIDPQGLLTEDSRQFLRGSLWRWLDETYNAGWPAIEVVDRLHRQARMQRWVGHTLMADACASISINALYGHDLMRRCLTMPVRQRYLHRIQLELLRAFDDTLWRLPFAGDTWSPALVPQRWKLARPIRGHASTLTRPWIDWDTHKDELLAFLERPSSSPFFDLINRDAVLAHTKRLRAKRPTHRQLHTTYGLCGIRFSLENPLQAKPIHLESP